MSAQLVPLDWLARNSGVRRHLAFDAVFGLLFALCRNLPTAGRYVANYQAVVAGRSRRAGSYHDTQFFLHGRRIAKAVFASFLPGDSWPCNYPDVMGGVLYEPAHYLSAFSWIPTLLNHTRVLITYEEKAGVVGDCRIRVGGTLGALLLGAC